jgi:23S rRNA pseudouridine1911/1915/1917 synthase
MREFEAGPERFRLDEFLGNELRELSLIKIRRLISDGDVLINGDRSLKGRRLDKGDRVLIQAIDDGPTSATPEAIPIRILHEDDDLIVIDKEAGLLTHPSRRAKSGTLTNALAHHFLQTTGRLIRPGIVHRLDRDTSGVIVVAKTRRAHRILTKAFLQRRIGKSYLSLLSGVVIRDSGEIEAPIGCDFDAWPRWRAMDAGRPAVTRYRVRRRFDAHTFVELEALTGRTHQLRIHCALAGHPIVGDAFYATVRDPIADQCGIGHHLLHAHRLTLIHPTHGGEMEFEAPLPALIQVVLSSL